MAHIIVTATAEVLAQRAAHDIIQDLNATIRAKGTATWVIAGGSSPMAAYRLIAADIHSVDWSKVTFVIGDERCVAFDSPDSNWTQIETVLLQFLTSSSLVSRPHTNLDAKEAARSYERALLSLPRNDQNLPRLDHVWLGVGEDGHTLSLFPHHPSLMPSDYLVIPVYDSPKPPLERISLTPKTLRGTVNCTILAVGAGKAAIISQALAGDTSLPIALVAETIEKAGGKVTWLLDQAAVQ